MLVAAVLGVAACGAGRWDVNPAPSPVRAIHAALLPSGKVLLVAGSGNQRDAFEAGEFKTSVWDPVENTFTDIDTPWDAFCAGHAQLPDGRLLVAGGTASYETPETNDRFSGTSKAYTFDPSTDSYERVEDMDTARWYPSLVTMGDGSVLAVAGQGSDGLLTYTWQRFVDDDWTDNEPAPRRDDVQNARQRWPLYPGLHLMADGRVFFSGAHTFGTTPPSGIWDLADNTFHAVDGLPDEHHTDHAMSVLLPPAQDQRVMIFGGGSDDGSLSTESTAIIDLTDEDPQWAPAVPLDTPKMYVSAVILPDRTVFETGGAKRFRDAPNNSYVFSSQLFDPATGEWTKGKDSGVARGYHSSALLLPDGRVATFGNQPASGGYEPRIEIYSPEYLDEGPRPEITDAPSEVTYGGTYEMTTTQDAPIASVSLVRPMAVTHSVDGNQRLVDVPFTTDEDDGTLELAIPENPNLTPPGWYMLFAVDETGVPSVASWVHVGPASDVVPEPVSG